MTEDDIGHINARFVKGEITLNQYVAAMEKRPSLAKDATTTNPGDEDRA